MPDLQSALAELTSGDDARAEAAAPGLAGHGRAALEALADLLEAPDPDLRWWAVRGLAELDGAGNASLLVEALHDENLAVRQCAALALHQRPTPQALPDLIALLAAPDSLLARLAGNALIALGARATAPLLDVLENGEPHARLEAARALAAIGDHASIPALFELLDGESSLMEHWASQGLERMGVGMAFFNPG